MKNLILLVVLFVTASTFAQTETSLQLARKQYQEENYAEVIKLLDKAAVEEPTNAQVPYLMGRAYVDMSNYKKAVTFLEKAIAMDSTKGNWMYECALVYQSVPDYKKSLKLMLLAGDKGYKKTNDYLENLGNTYIKLGDNAKGAEVLSEVLKKKPDDPELIFQIAQANYKAGKYQEAIDMWDRAFTIDSTNAEALYMIGLAYQKKGDKDKGQQICDRAILMDPSLKLKREQSGGGGL
jgi:tetratricopeptide (TPR) repeat protein